MIDPAAIAARLEAEARTAGPEVIADLVVRLGGDLRGRRGTVVGEARRIEWDEDEADRAKGIEPSR